MTTMPHHYCHRRRHLALALLVGVMLVRTFLFSFDGIEEAQHSRRILASSTLKDLAGLDKIAKEDFCLDIMIEAKIEKVKRNQKVFYHPQQQVLWGKATQEQKAQWTAMDCVNALSLFTPRVLGYNDTLRDEVHQSTMSLRHQQAQFNMVKVIMAHLRQKRIRFSPAFGTLLGIVRNGVAVVPWDDDIDFLVDNREGDFRQKLTMGLQKVKKNHVRGPRHGLEDAWSLAGRYILYYKNRGTSWKIHPKGKAYPRVDLYPFQKQPDAPERDWINPKIIKNGHLKTFSKPDVWFGSMTKTMAVAYSTDIPDLIEFPMPDDALAVVVDDYGEESLTRCKVSFTHNPDCRDSKMECQRTLASRLARLEFPCVLLPEKLHGVTLVNEARHRG